MLAAFFLIAVAVTIPSQTNAKAQAGGESAGAAQVYIGTAVGGGDFGNLVDGDLGSASVPFKLVITGLTSDQYTQAYANILKTKGQQTTLEAMSNVRLGSFSLAGHPDAPVRFVQERRTECGRSIVVLCDRWLNKFVEGYEDSSSEYPFAYIEVSVDNLGQGEGMMFTVAKIKFYGPRGNAVGVEDYGNYPDRLTNVVAAQVTAP